MKGKVNTKIYTLIFSRKTTVFLGHHPDSLCLNLAKIGHTSLCKRLGNWGTALLCLTLMVLLNISKEVLESSGEL